MILLIKFKSLSTSKYVHENDKTPHLRSVKTEGFPSGLQTLTVHGGIFGLSGGLSMGLTKIFWEGFKRTEGKIERLIVINLYFTKSTPQFGLHCKARWRTHGLLVDNLKFGLKESLHFSLSVSGGLWIIYNPQIYLLATCAPGLFS